MAGTNKKYEQVEKEIFKNKIKKLEKIKGRHTELISLYVPFGTDRGTVMSQLMQEVNQASNIKSPTTRKNVQAALRKIAEYLRLIDFKLPDNGVVVFCGNISEREGRPDIQLFHVTPIRKLNMKTYRCDSEFLIDPLKEMLTPDKSYLIIAIDNRESTTAVLEGKKYRIIDKAHSTVPGKIKAGGQSAHRYEHLRLDAANDFYHRVAEHINKEIMPYIDKIEGVVLGGPGSTKKDFFEKEYLDYRIRDKTIGFLDVTYTNESGIREIIDAAQDLLKETEIVIEKQAIAEFFKAAIKSSLAAYGFDDVISALKTNRANKVLVSEGLNKEIKIAECLTCKKTKILFDEKDSKKCECTGDLEEIETLSLAEYITELSEKNNTEVIIISTDTDEGEQFLNAFGGIGAILRY